MTLNDWTRAIAYWLDAHTNAPGKLESYQATMMLGSIMTVMRNELSADAYAAVLAVNALSESAAQVYRARFAGHAEVREEAATI